MRHIIILIAVLTLPGCVLSTVAPITGADQLVELPGFVGSWVEGDENKQQRWEVEAGGERAYKLTVTESNGSVGRFTGRATKIGQHTVIVITPAKAEPGSDTLGIHTVALSGVYPIEKVGDNWTVTPLDHEKMMRLAEEDDNVDVRKLPLAGGRALRVLIAEPGALRTFLEVNIEQARQAKWRMVFRPDEPVP